MHRPCFVLPYSEGNATETSRLKPHLDVAHKMSEQDRIALLALIVSLVALLIATLQLTQQLFGTAEGWRRCDYLVIGAWARLRRSRWRWGEFRYETRYTTPEIFLTTGDADRANALPTTVWLTFFVKHYRDSYTLLDPQAPREITETIESSKGLAESRVDKPHSRFSLISKQNDAEEGYGPGLHLSRGTQHEEYNSDRFVSWIPLIKGLAEVWKEYQNQGCLYKGVDASSQVDEKRKNTTYVEIRFREHSWDMMPPDVIRPLAFIRLGHVVIVMRLGMRWLELGTRSETLRAAGNRGTLSSTTVRGLGTVVQFNFKSTPRKSVHPRHIVPSVAADKMMCGIIPACEELGIDQDIELVDERGKLSLLQNVLQMLEIPETAREKIMEAANNPKSYWQHGWHHWEHGKPFHPALYDMVSLLCPFVLIPDCTATELVCPMPMNQGKNVRSPFHFWEGRLALLDCFRKYRGEHESQAGEHRNYLHQLSEDFESLERDYGKLRPVGKVISAKELTNGLRAIHRRTTGFFRGLMNEPSEKRPKAKYINIVGAHITTATGAGESAYKDWDDGKNQPKVDWGPRNKVRDNVSDWVLIGRKYAEKLPEFVEDVRERMGKDRRNEGKMKEFDKVLIELAWWTLVVRGISWNRSVKCDFPAEVVPSSFYEDPTPVWIM